MGDRVLRREIQFQMELQRLVSFHIEGLQLHASTFEAHDKAIGPRAEVVFKLFRTLLAFGWQLSSILRENCDPDSLWNR